MIIDDEFIKRFRLQINVLTNLNKSVQGAIERANVRLAELIENRGKDTEQVFGRLKSEQRPAPQYHETSDYR